MKSIFRLLTEKCGETRESEEEEEEEGRLCHDGIECERRRGFVVFNHA